MPTPRWQPEQAAALIPELARLGVELIEQPFPARALPQLRWLRERSSLPILADESAVFEDDLPMLEGVVDGVVVKLAKCGGIGPGLRMIRRARQLGMRSCSAACSSRAWARLPEPWSPPRSTGWTSTAT